MAKDPITREVKSFCRTRDFIGVGEMEDLRSHFTDSRYERPLELELDRHFVKSQCPACGAPGMLRWHFLGRMRHPHCATWYAGSWIYAKRMLKFAAGGALALGDGFGDDGAAAIVLLVLGAAVGLAAFLIMTPLQLLIRSVVRVRRQAA